MRQHTNKAWAKWQRLVSEQERSGQNVKAFCHERGLCRSYFYAWKKRLRESSPEKFVEVQLATASAEPSTQRDAWIEIRLRNGRSLVVGRRCDTEQVRALVAVVETA